MLKFLLFFILSISPLMTACSQGPKVVVASTQSTPKTRTRQLVVIDPGHGGFDIGAKVQSLEEKALALKMATLLKKYLHDMGYRVILTRSRDVFVSLKRRTAIANDTKSKLFVSVHFNAFKGENVKGIEVYYYNKGSTWRKNASKRLAETVLKSLIVATSASSRGVKCGNFHVIRETKMPAILIEGGFITNQQERNHLKKKKYVQAMARSIAKGIDKYFRT
ncbi:MAG: Sporulation-specific N-acetylmuramoyl-L-alanine amidase [Chlamydiae bacterium]|nr:Sporulation-specific N-acetylmuramoyl-L-alanine amidase [Chlamydiota bacterium]